jgi:hypothetical protein
MLYIELGGSRSSSVAVSGDPGIIDAVNYLEREIDWPNVALEATVTLVAAGSLPSGGSMLIQLAKIVAGVVDSVAVEDDTAITSTDFTEHEIAVPREATKTKYRLRATVTAGDGLEALILGVLRESLTGDELASPCEGLRTAFVNKAASIIGVSEQLIDLETDDTVLGTQGRLHIDGVLDLVLRRFPWGFATAYADLVWVAGSSDEPVNQDWTWAYRLPSDCVFARRIVRLGAGRERDPDPPAFRQGANDDGRLLFSTYADPNADDPLAPTVHLEYTKRATCVVAEADEQFLEAAAFLLASKLAPSMSRNKVTAGECLQAYEVAIGRARVSSANEKQETRQLEQASWMDERN